jgi:quercetin dioxygenase-like cupin family protein
MRTLILLWCIFVGVQLKAEAPMGIQFFDFDEMSGEKLSDKISRTYVYGKNAMLARFTFKKGAVVPKHEHPNEQITYILKGSVKVTTKDKTYIVKAGQVLVIPPNTFHEFEALEDTIDIDVFSPPRQDWINGTDTYLQNQNKIK